MAWQEVLGHDRVVAQFRRALARGRMASTFLFVGPAGIGKRTFALKLAQGLLCDKNNPVELNPCGKCPACAQVAAGTHPDVEVVSRPPEKAFLPLELFIGEGENRMREGLCYNISLKPYGGRRRIAIIDDADYFNREGANCLLKTLEEPPPNAVLILIGTSEQRQLPTIRSRCQTIRFRSLNETDVATLLLRSGVTQDDNEAARAASQAKGSLERASESLDSDLTEFRDSMLDQLADRQIDPAALAKATNSFVDAAGKDAPARRARTKQLVHAAAEFYERLMRRLTSSEPPPREDAVAKAARWWPGGTDATAWCIENCFDTHAAIESNANLATLLDCWFDELATISRTGKPLVG